MPIWITYGVKMLVLTSMRELWAFWKGKVWT